MEKYVIQSLLDLGYWSPGYGEFKGILFAKRYDTEDQAKEVARGLAKKNKTPLTVIPIFE